MAFSTSRTAHSQPVSETGNIARQRLKVRELNNYAVRYFYMCDYLKSYGILLQALDLCEKYPGDPTEHMIHANIGNIYYRFNEYGMAKRYYSRALEVCRDSTSIMLLYNNISDAELQGGELDNALYHLDRSLEISRRIDSTYLHILLNTKAAIYREKRLYDAAFHSLRLAVEYARGSNSVEFEAENLSDLGKLFFETGKPDSTIFYITASNFIARENKLYNILLENHLELSKLAESLRHHADALEELKKYSNLKDSIFSADRLMEINNLQRLYEVSKTDRQIEGLSVEQKIKERIIGHQKVVLGIIFTVLMLMIAILLAVFFQKRKLNKAYKALFEKNIEIMELKESSPPKKSKNPQQRDGEEELTGRILKVMEEVEIICNPNFSINMLASLVRSNHIYVSQAINNGLNKNFRSLLNGYRIREAQRLFAEPDAVRYTIESVSLMVGYKSRSTFREAFAEITGVSPSFYLKSLQGNA